MRAHARKSGDGDLINLWAGDAHALAEELPAAEIVAKLHREAQEALRAALGRLGQ
jgi:nitronate monooxygenase